ncbi:MAG: MurR/RpiR family transcriptional regulator [Candidatus Binatia bacterium]
MERNLNYRIVALRRGLGPQMARMADYVMENGDQACFLNVRKLASAAGVSAPTAVRFVRRLGYKDFQSFKNDLQKNLRERLRARKTAAGIGTSRRPNSFIREIFEQEALAIENSLQLVREEDFEAALDAVCRADTVYLLGGKTSFALAYFLYFRLSKLGIDCKLIHFGGPSLFREMAAIGSRDLLIAIGFQRIAAEVQLAAKEARRKKAAVVAITDPPASPISALADVALYADRGPRMKMRSMTAYLALCTAVVAGVAGRKGKRSARIAAEVDALENGAGNHRREG